MDDRLAIALSRLNHEVQPVRRSFQGPIVPDLSLCPYGYPGHSERICGRLCTTRYAILHIMLDSGVRRVSKPSVSALQSREVAGYPVWVPEGASPPRNALFLALAEPRLCQSQKKCFCGGGFAAPAAPLNCQVQLKHA